MHPCTPVYTQHPLQSLLCEGNGGGGLGRGDMSPDTPFNNNNAGDLSTNPVANNSSGGGGGDDTAHGSFSEIEECLWLRVFSAIESHATPCRTEPRHGPTPPHLIPLTKAVASVQEIFGGEGDRAAAAALAAGSATSAATTAAIATNRRKNKPVREVRCECKRRV